MAHTDAEAKMLKDFFRSRLHTLYGSEQDGSDTQMAKAATPEVRKEGEAAASEITTHITRIDDVFAASDAAFCEGEPLRRRAAQGACRVGSEPAHA